MRESLQKSQTITNNVVSILGSFNSRLFALETTMRPIQIRTHYIRKAHENINKTLKSAKIILEQFDLSHQAEIKILKGPYDDLESYLEALDQLRNSNCYFSSKKSFRNSDVVVNHANSLLVTAILKLEDEFKRLLTSYSKPIQPDCLFDCLPKSLCPASRSPGDQGDAGGKTESTNHSEHHKNDLENAAHTTPTLIPPSIMPLVHDLAQQMVQAGHQQ
ncbi:hypothetical protein SLA2020_300320 [Shorea laevis]